MIRAIQFQSKRVGSTFLQQAINSHPDIVGIDEVFVNKARPDVRKSGFVPYINSDVGNPTDYLKYVINSTYPNQNTIFKLMYNQVVFHNQMKDVFRTLPIIHLMRKNLVKQIVSYRKMAKYNHDPIDISPHQLLYEVQQADTLNQAYSGKDNIKLTLYYEDIIGDTKDGYTYVTETAMRSICEFFEVNYFPLCASTKKKNKDDVSVYLPNIREIREYFKNYGDEYLWMLE